MTIEDPKKARYWLVIASRYSGQIGCEIGVVGEGLVTIGGRRLDTSFAHVGDYTYR